jgi:phosphoheptose isomerase
MSGAPCRQAFGQPGDVAVGISTSGNSPNVIKALEEAKKRNLKTIGLAGKDGGILAGCVDVPIIVRFANTARVQECHIAIGHLFCELVEEEMFDSNSKH